MSKPLIAWRRLLKPSQWPYYRRLYKVNRLAERFRAEHEHSALDIRFHPDFDARLDVYSPPAGRGNPVLVYVHGGGWRRGAASVHSIAY